MKLLSMIKITYIINGLKLIKLGWSKDIIDFYIKDYTRNCNSVLKDLKITHGLEPDSEMRVIKLNNKN